jgi:hypothetical protein
MKKSFFGFWVLIIYSLLIFNSACKKTEEILQPPQGLFVISKGISKVMFFHFEDITCMAIYSSVSSQNEIGGIISSWKFIFKSGNTELLEINNTNYSSFALYKYGISRVAAFGVGTLNLSYTDNYREGYSPFQGKLFDANPDNLDAFITITDDNGNMQTLQRNVAVAFEAY